MGHVRVVVRFILGQQLAQVTLVIDQDPVCALAPYAACPAFGDRVRRGRADRRLDIACTERGEHFVEDTGELGIPVADAELDGLGALTQVHGPISCLLGGPGSRLGWPLRP